MNDIALADEARTRRALLHILEDLQREKRVVHEARQQWLDTVDAVGDAMMVHDENYRIVRSNRAYAERAGLAVRELIGRPYWECFPKGEGPCGPEVTLPGGETFVARSFPIRKGEEGQHDTLWLFEDVTEKRRAEQTLRRALEATIEAIAATVESRDPYTAGHQKRVAELAVAIAREMGLSPHDLVGIHFGALIHDLGKVQVPAELLSKPTRLSKAEFELIKTHPQAGYDIVKGIEFPWPVAAMVHQHHERLDGTGYPQGLKGDAIAKEARILAVADVVEAMASHRPYRPGLGIDAALKEIEDKRGTWFDAQAVDACLRLFREGRFAFGSGR